VVDAAHTELLKLRSHSAVLASSLPSTSSPTASGYAAAASHPTVSTGGGSVAAGGEDEEWCTVGRKNKVAVTRKHEEEPVTMISDIFRGRLKSTVKTLGKQSCTCAWLGPLSCHARAGFLF
jgi:hypothetical protein